MEIIQLAGAASTPNPQDKAACAAASKAEADRVLFEELRGIIDACGGDTNRHDLATVLIEACIINGLDTRGRIRGALGRLGFDHAHVMIVLKEGTGSSPLRHRWRVDDQGTYSSFAS